MRKTALMKQTSTLLSVIAIIGVFALGYLHFTHTEKVSKQISAVSGPLKDSTNFRIAYFDIDSLQANYKGFKDAEDQIKAEEGVIKSELSNLNNSNQRRLKELQERAPTMSQAEGQAAERELAQRSQQFAQREAELDQRLKRYQMEKITDLQKTVESYLKKFNEKKGYSFIVSYRPGEFMYYRDTAYDITRELVEGLNKEYTPVKKNK